MKRLLKIAVLLYVATLLLMSGLDYALGRMAEDPRESSFTLYDQNGANLVFYNGDVMSCDRFTHLYRMTKLPLPATAALTPRT